MLAVVKFHFTSLRTFSSLLEIFLECYAIETTTRTITVAMMAVTMAHMCRVLTLSSPVLRN